MGTFAALKSINAEQGGYAGSPAIAVINAQASATSLANRLQPLGITSTNNNIVLLGEGVSHFGVRARVAGTTITTMPSVNIYRLYGPAESFTSTTIANDGTVSFDVVNHSDVYASAAASNVYNDTVQAFAFTASVATAAVTDSPRDGTYIYSQWARGDASPVWFYDAAGASLVGGSDQAQLIPTRGARAVLVLHTVQANISGGSDTCDVLVYPFARGNMG